MALPFAAKHRTAAQDTGTAVTELRTVLVSMPEARMPDYRFDAYAPIYRAPIMRQPAATLSSPIMSSRAILCLRASRIR